jgi:hypothetical protein
MNTSPRQWQVVRIERWNDNTKTYAPFTEDHVLMKVNSRSIVDDHGRRFNPKTGLCMNRFFPGQKYRYSLKLNAEVKHERTDNGE